MADHGERLARLEERSERMEKDISAMNKALAENTVVLTKGKATASTVYALLGLLGATIVGVIVNWLSGRGF